LFGVGADRPEAAVLGAPALSSVPRSLHLGTYGLDARPHGFLTSFFRFRAFAGQPAGRWALLDEPSHLGQMTAGNRFPARVGLWRRRPRRGRAPLRVRARPGAHTYRRHLVDLGEDRAASFRDQLSSGAIALSTVPSFFAEIEVMQRARLGQPRHELGIDGARARLFT
jgi:hypothetical protein